MLKALESLFKSSQKVNEELYSITNHTLQSALRESLSLSYDVPNQTFLNQLQTSVRVFSAFKAHEQTQLIASFLLDENGKPVGFSEFKSRALKVSQEYNKNWLRTEYNTALRRARMAGKFQGFKRQSKLYPNLKWLPSTSSHPRSSHVRFYGLVLPVEHEFWINNFPGSEWNCKCDVGPTKQAAHKAPDLESNPPRGLEGNPAFTGDLFGGKHPYFTSLSKADRQAVNSFVSLQTDKAIKAWAYKKIPAKQAIISKIKNLQSGEFYLDRKTVKSLLASQSDPFLKTYINLMLSDAKNLSYEGFEKRGKLIHSIYKTRYNEKTIYLKMKLENGVEKPVGILTQLPQGVLIKEPLPI